jgi:hypothetical protein
VAVNHEEVPAAAAADACMQLSLLKKMKQVADRKVPGDHHSLFTLSYLTACRPPSL